MDKYVDFQAYKDYDYKRCEEEKVPITPSRLRMWNNGQGAITNQNCDNLSFNQVQDVTGDGWTVDVISHILSFIPEIEEYKNKKL